MTIHYDRHGMGALYMHAWSDGGGSYATVVEPIGGGHFARVTMFSDTVEVYDDAALIELTPEDAALIREEYSMTDDYAATFSTDLTGNYGGDPYIILSHGHAYAVDMFGTFLVDVD